MVNAGKRGRPAHRLVASKATADSLEAESKKMKRTSAEKKVLRRARKAEAQLSNGVAKIFEDGCKDGVEYCKTALINNPKWVPVDGILPKQDVREYDRTREPERTGRGQ